MNPVTEAIENDSVAKMKSLLKFYAIRKYASMDMLELMLENGIDLHEVDSDGISALDMARKSGITPVMLASCFSDLDMMKLLLDNGGDINLSDKSGMAPKDYAKKLGQKKMLEFLDEQGARFNVYPNE